MLPNYHLNMKMFHYSNETQIAKCSAQFGVENRAAIDFRLCDVSRISKVLKGSLLYMLNRVPAN